MASRPVEGHLRPTQPFRNLRHGGPLETINFGIKRLTIKILQTFKSGLGSKKSLPRFFAGWILKGIRERPPILGELAALEEGGGQKGLMQINPEEMAKTYFF